MFRQVLGTLFIVSACATAAAMLDQGKQAVLSASTDASIVFEAPNGLPDPNEILEIVNIHRQKNSLPLLHPNADLAVVARSRAADMSTQNYYAHKTPQGKDFDDLLREKRFYVSFGCENLDLSFSKQPTVYVEDWLSSSKGHRECLLDKDISQAGYAVSTLPPTDYSGQPLTPYVIVAIHTTSP